MENPGDEGTVRLSHEEALALGVEVLGRHGFTLEEARTIANHLVEAEMRGHSATGLVRLRNVVAMAANGRGVIRVVRDGPAFAHVDGGGNPAYLSGEFASRLAIEKARSASVAVVGLWNSSLGGMSGHYVRRVAEAGLVGALFSNSFARVAPFGGIDPLIGTNPIAFAFPCDPEPIVVDAATSLLSNAEVEAARRRGEPLPPGSAVDQQGRLTEDPASAVRGALLPIAGHKGYALGLAMQLFGALAGGEAVPTSVGNFGYFFLAVDPGLFGSLEDFQRRAAELRDRVKDSRRAQGTEEILLPGEGSERRRRKNLEEGIQLPAKLIESLRSL